MPTSLAVLSGVSVGMWSAKKDQQGMWFLIVPRRQLFVFIVESEDGGQSKRRGMIGPSTSTLLRQLGAHSPFSSVIHKEGGCAFAFEVPFDNVSGIDYSNSLLRDGRLVLECFNVRKREFESLDAAFTYYGGADGEATRASLDALFGEASPYRQQQQQQMHWDMGAAATPSPSPQKLASSPLRKPLVSPVVANQGDASVAPVKRTRSKLLARLGGALTKTTKSANKDNKDSPSLSVKTQRSLPSESACDSMPLPSSSTMNVSFELDSPEIIPQECSTPRLFTRTLAGDSPDAFSRPKMRISHSTGDLLASATSSPFKAPAATLYEFRLITVHWSDSQLPEILRPVIESNEQLLRMYESGLPTWATLFPMIGLYYRPWLRSLTWVLFYAFSFFSLAIGFYDLYKTLPGLQALLSRAVEGLGQWPKAVVQWVETHAQVRLSILLTYIFGKSEMLVYVVKMMGHAKRTLVEATGPLVTALGPPLSALWQAGISPILAVFAMISEFLTTLVVPPIQALYSAVVLPVSWVSAAVQHAAVAGQGVAAGSAAANATPWLLRGIPADALEALRGSLGRATRAAQSVWRFFMNMVQAFSRHRLTWARRARRWRQRMKEKLLAALWFPIEAIIVCSRWIYAIINLMIAAAKAGAAREQEEQRAKAAAEAAAAAVARQQASGANGSSVTLGDHTDNASEGINNEINDKIGHLAAEPEESIGSNSEAALAAAAALAAEEDMSPLEDDLSKKDK